MAEKTWFTDRDAVFETVGRAHESFGRLDIVVDNAGYGQFGMVEELSEQGSGHFLQVSSIGGISAFPGIGMYHASKWALEGISQALAQEIKDFGLHVTLIEPDGFSPLRAFFGSTPLGVAEKDYERRLETWREWQPVAELPQGTAS